MASVLRPSSRAGKPCSNKLECLYSPNLFYFICLTLYALASSKVTAQLYQTRVSEQLWLDLNNIEKCSMNMLCHLSGCHNSQLVIVNVHSRRNEAKLNYQSRGWPQSVSVSLTSNFLSKTDLNRCVADLEREHVEIFV